MSAGNRLVRVLYRSMLKWTFGKTTKRVPFNLITEAYGPKLYTHLSSGLGATPAPSLQPHPRSLEDMRQFISHSFRSLPTNSSNLDKAFDVLKALNATTSHLNRLILDNERFGRPDVLEHAPFRVGQIVRIVENGVSIRGVVKDWTVDLATKKQTVSIILDAIDFNEHSSELLQLRTPEITLDSSKVFHETRANLKRICNETLRQHFLSYDEWYHHNRHQAVVAENQPIGGSYVPNQTLLFRYPLDYVPSPPLDDASPLKSRASVGGYNSVKDSAQHVMATAQNVGKYLGELVASRHMGKSKQDKKNPVLDDIQYLITSLTQTSSSASYTELQSLVQNHSFPLEHILHPSHAFQDTYRTLKTLTELYLTVDQLLQLRFQRFGISYIDNLNPTSSNQSSSSETLASSAGESDRPTFQSSVPISPIVRHLDKESSSPSATFALGQICKHSKFGYKCVITGFDQRPLMDVSGWEAVKGSKYGKEQPFYRCVPDETDVENWLGQGAFRTSFYVAQENLIPYQQPQSQIQTSQVPSKNKEMKPAPPIRHRDISMYFDKYDSNTKKFIAATKLRFCFPTSPSQTNVTVGGTGVAATQTEEEAKLLEEEEEFLRCEALLVEIHQTLKQSLIATREGYLKKYNVAQQQPRQQQQQQQAESINSSSQADYTSAPSTSSIPSFSMDHLFKLLKHATNREDAKITDALISLIGMSHYDTQISKLVRCAISEQKRGSFSKAFEYFQVASAIDPLFAEAHYRQACLNQKAREFNEAIRRYKISLSLFPHHYGSLAGLGSVYENRSNLSSAKAAITSSLDIHPWQEFLPTLLSLVHNAEDSIKSPNSNATPTPNATEQNSAATTASSVSEVNSKNVQ